MALKRVFDLCFAAAALLVLWPLLAALGIWIKSDSAGPIFFRQMRVGRYGKPFRIFKLRTMRIGATAFDREITVGNDSRITRAGTLLRKYKLDELPQFLNVLLGDMSVVGPRPEVPRYVALYPPDMKALVLSVRPGITDLASIAFREESALLAGSDAPEQLYVDTVLPIKLRHAIDYVNTRGFWGDALIIYQTAREVFLQRQ